MLGATFGLARRLRCSSGMPLLVTIMRMVPGGSSCFSAVPIAVSCAAASATEMPGAKRT